jgi:serine/threonine-protein kinase 24/25/MST4
MPPPSVPSVPRGSQRTVQREPSDEYEDYDDQYLDTYPAKVDPLSHRMEDVQLEDDLPDTTMLDSVILPAIASVSAFSFDITPLFMFFI